MDKKYDHKDAEVQTFAAFVHGALFGLHALGAVYNVKRKNWSAALIHTLVGTWDIMASFKHYENSKDI